MKQAYDPRINMMFNFDKREDRLQYLALNFAATPRELDELRDLVRQRALDFIAKETKEREEARAREVEAWRRVAVAWRGQVDADLDRANFHELMADYLEQGVSEHNARHMLGGITKHSK
jgi:hypothetical protein